MLERFAYGFYMAGVTLSDIKATAESFRIDIQNWQESRAVIGSEFIENQKNKLKSIRVWCEAVGLQSSVLGIDRIINLPNEDFTRGSMHNIFAELDRRIEDELKSVLFLYLPSERIAFYLDTAPFGDDVAAKFPSSAYDLEEASKSLVLERATACVFHLMRALETPLTLLATELGVGFSPNWNKYLEQVDTIAKGIREKKIPKPADWKEREKFYSEASGLLRNVKNSWRNEVMHLEKKYTLEEATRIFYSARHFMQFLAEHLEEKPSEETI